MNKDIVESDSRCCCACLRVEYKPEEVGNGLMRERWLCVSCGMEFKKKRAGLNRVPCINEITKTLDDSLVKNYPKTATLLTCLKWNNIPNIMNKLAKDIHAWLKGEGK